VKKWAKIDVLFPDKYYTNEDCEILKSIRDANHKQEQTLYD